MEKRFRSKDSSQWASSVRAKTGTLTEPVTVSSLAGYLYHPKHGLVAFAIIHNGVPKKTQPDLNELHQMEDRAITRLFNLM
jgi:D-alanyl-D-alanine carboxypeptidase/D-alanyl-D-alanine-endopeptidase (penicillin-binding protein 4)